MIMFQSNQTSIVKVERSAAYDIYDIKIKKMGDYTEIIKYSKKLMRLKSGLSLSDEDKTILALNRASKSDNNKSDNIIRMDSISRSYNRLLSLSMTNSKYFKSFITLTFKENITNLTFANKKFNIWVSNIRKLFPDFLYLGVPEFQKRGAVHYHLMSNLDPKIHNNIIMLQKNKNDMYDVKYWSHGFSSVFDLSLSDSNFSVALYLSKYFYKDIDNRLFGRNKILKSNNLIEPTIELINSNTDEIDKINLFVSNMELVKEKEIQSDKPYIPNIHIMQFKNIKY